MATSKGRAHKAHVKSLYYITHINNIPSILEHGILSHALVEQEQVPFTPIYDTAIVTNRRERYAPDGNTLWNFANLYFQPRNPMLYRVISEKGKKDIAIIGVSPAVLDIKGTFVTTGNAASSPTDILPQREGLDAVTAMWDVVMNEWWKEEDGSKRKIMAECLVPERIGPEHIHTIFVAGRSTADEVLTSIPGSSIPVVPEPQMFFQPRRTIRLTNLLSLVDGDMFFSQRQTLTISVNTVGVMGKGLASRTKYQFPDVYVIYQDVCRQKQLVMGQPYLYKRESSLDSELAEDPLTLPNLNANKWFLLFATKRHWKENSDAAGIEQGLIWLVENYQKLEIRSLALPALGCGLGGLEWRDIGPMMCRYLVNLNIPVSIYLPREQDASFDHLTARFLLGA
jgi:hypothetical protein